MIIRHTAFHPNFVELIKEKKKLMFRRPLLVQPSYVDMQRGVLTFGDDPETYVFYLDDYPCLHGEPGDLLVMHLDGNPIPFHEAKVLGRHIEQLSDITAQDLAFEACADRGEFLRLWDEIYGETRYAAIFNPWVWVIRYA